MQSDILGIDVREVELERAVDRAELYAAMQTEKWRDNGKSTLCARAFVSMWVGGRGDRPANSVT